MTAPKTDAIERCIRDSVIICVTHRFNDAMSQLSTLLSTLASVTAERDRYKGALEEIVKATSYGPDLQAMARDALEATP